MDRLVAPLNPGDTGPQIANLQDALRLLLDRGVIRSLDPPNSPTAEELAKLGQRLSAEREQSIYGNATQRLVLYVQLQEGLGDGLGGEVETKTAALLNRFLKKLGVLDEPPTNEFTVKGVVTQANGEPAVGMEVRAFDRDLRTRGQVGQMNVTGEDGRYEIVYSQAEFIRAEKGSADLIIRAEQHREGFTAFVESHALFNAPAVAEVNLQLPDTTIKQSEFERHITTITPLLVEQGNDGSDLPISELTDKDVDFIVRESGIERQHLTWLIQAANFELRSRTVAPEILTHVTARTVPAEVFYGWFRQGLTTDFNALVTTSLDTLIATFNAAIQQNIVPSSLSSDSDKIAKQIEHLQRESVLQAPALGTRASLRSLLAISPSPLTQADQHVLAAAMNDLHPEAADLVQRITKIPNFQGDAVGVAQALRLGALTGGHIPLAQALQLRLRQAEEREGTLRPLAMIRRDEWIDLAYAHGTPDGDAVAPAAFADTLATRVERQYPTAALVAHLMEGRPLAQHPLLTGVDKFLHENPAFDIVSANLNAVKDQTAVEGHTDPEQVGRGLLALQRFNSLGVNWHETATLFENDLYSPPQLLAAGPTQLAQLLEGQLAPERIMALHEQVVELHNVTFAAVTAALSPLSGPDVLPGSAEPLPDTEEPGGPVGLKDLVRLLKSRDGRFDPNKYKSLGPIAKGALDRIRDHLNFDDVVTYQPTLQSLFGSQDACMCGHCSSVLGPAAYFVDVLQFIRNASPNAQLLNRLLHRRRDLQDIELSCSNTHSEVPAIDLAIEILENAVALPLPIDLPPGTTLEEELRDKQPVGAAIRIALEKTVRSFAGEGRATWTGANGDGTTDWTVIDRHRRWTLSARPENALMGQTGKRGLQMLDTTGVNVDALIKALDKKTVARDSEAAFARLISPNRDTEYSNYQVTVTPLMPGRLWKVAYRIVAELVLEAEQLTLRIPGGKPWLVNRYSQKTIEGIQGDLANDKTPELVRLLIDSRFPDAGRLNLKPVESRREKVWAIASEERALTLTYTPAHLTIISLAYQSGDPSADPIAEPENHNPEAYARLKNANFPWSLPLDLPLEEVRLFLERARSSRRQLKELLLPVDAITSANLASLATELLGLSEAEATLIGVESATPTVYDYWGIPETQDNIFDAATGRYLRGTPPLVLLKNVSILLQQSRLSFEELQAVIETQFVTLGGTAPLLILPRVTCKPSEMNVLQLTPGHLDRLHRFIRLWRRMGWTTHELDLAIQAFGGLLTSETLISLAGLKRLKQELGLPVAVLVGGLDRLETQSWVDYFAEDAPEQRSLYATIFQREAVCKGSDYTDFALRADSVELQNTPTLGISAHAEYVGNCIGVRSSVVTDWVSAGNALGVVDKLDLANLSRLTAAANLCNALRMDPEQLTHHLKLRGTSASPFRSGLTVHERVIATLEFVEGFRNIAKAGIDAETLRYVLEHYDVPGSNANLSAVQLLQLAAAAREAVRSIPAATEKASSVAADPESAAIAAATLLAREDTAIASLATGLGGTRELVDELLRKRLRHPSDATKRGIDALLATEFTTTEVSHSPTAPIPPDVLVDPALKAKVNAADKAVDDLIVRVHKSLLLCNALKFTSTELSLLRASANDANGFTAVNFNLLPVTSAEPPASILGFEQLLGLARLRTLAPNGGDLLHRYIRPADSAAAWSAEGARRVLATGFALTEEEVEATADQIALTTDEQYRDPVALTRLVNLLAVLKKLGATVQLARELTSASPDDAAAIGARELLRSKYGESQWHNLIKPIEDKLRERQRGALVDYLVARDKLRNANDLYESYLIDVQTGSCMKTTRLLQATAAVQLFVQRVMLNLEPGASLSADKRALWDWMHSYRVWEANRKVFLFPENWLLPELRDDKTALFREMESALSENEPTQESMRSALIGYLEGLGDLAQISVISMCQDERVVGTDFQGQEIVKRTLYIVGRTLNTPYRYFWRSCAEFGSPEMNWSGWESLDLDKANDFIMPFVFEGELHVAWPIFHKTKEEVKEGDTAKLFWDVQLAWTRRTYKGWVKRKIGKAQLNGVERLSNKDEAGSFAFRFDKGVFPVPGSDSLMRETVMIDCFAAREAVPTPSAVPDLTRVNAEPDGAPYDSQYGPGYRWNVSCAVTGTVYRFFKRPQAEGGNYYAPCTNAEVKILDAKRQAHENELDNIEELPTYSKGTNENGQFRFDFPTYSYGKNAGEGLLNGGSLKLRIEVPGKPVFEKITTLVKKNQNSQDEYSLYWIWNIVYLVEDPELAKSFDEKRQVSLAKCGEFILETGKDLRSNQSRQGTPYVSEIDAFVAKTNSLALPLQIPVFAVHARQPIGSVDAGIWYVTESNSASYYLRIAGAELKRWADGQPFAATYRISAASSALALFQIENQRHLHLDPDANNFDRQTAYASYNWELFLHAPLAIADFLLSQQRFEDARRWLHVVFDPTTNKTVNSIPQFWRFLPFHNDSQPDGIAKLLTWLADPDSGDAAVESALTSQIEQWKQNPFMPHLIARLRPSAYQWHTFFAYLTVLIKWGDSLFRRDTRESVNEATLLYVLAAKLLGPRPRTIQAPASLPPQTYRTLSAGALDAFSNAWIQYADLPGLRKLLATAQSSRYSTPQQSVGVKQTGYQSGHTTGIQLLTSFSLAFCIPQNERIIEFYDLIEKRLFDVRHCRNIDGVFRELPLYDPPIDPLLLIRARAAGLDLATVIAELYAPLPNYRFTFTLQKALELCAEVKSLGGALLAVLEKQDAEELTLLRSTHEIAMLKLARDVRSKQLDEAEANIVALQQSQATVTERFNQFQKLLGKTSITRGQDGLPVVEQSSSLSVSTDPIGGASGLGLSRMEVDQLRFSAMAHLQTQIAGSVQVVAGVISLIPDIFAGTPFAGQTSGGSNFGLAANSVAKSIEMIAAEANYLASQAGTFGGFERRQDEWVHQSKLALAELKQLDKQVLAAQIRKNIAKNELDNHDQQMANAHEVDDFMRSKFTNQQLFRWMSSQIAEVYFRTYQLALDQARRAERTYRYELGLDDATTPFVQSDHWDSLKRGLLAGERLHHDLKRMESVHLERNVREFEITRHVSLLQLDPIALITLRETGSCDFTIPEALFDLDCPGHYMRRIKMVSLSIPCVTGTFASVSASLQLKKNETRFKSTGETYARLPAAEADSRFRTSTAPTMAIVTSGSQQDSGMFEPNLRDERYLPFEGAGVISTWHLELPRQLRQFDYDTISDVIVHIRYTSRDGGADLKDAAESYLVEQIGKAEAAGMVRLFSIRHEFPSAWTKFIATKIDESNVKTAELSLDLRPEHYPFWSKGRLKTVQRADVIARVSDEVDSIEIAEKPDGTGEWDTLDRPTDPNLSGLLSGTLANLSPSSPVGDPNKPFKLFFKQNSMTDLWIAIAWKGVA
jgi:hypothetical protein